MPYAAARGTGRCPAPDTAAVGDRLATPNYAYEKRQRELAKKRKQEEKRQKKLNNKDDNNDAPSDDSGEPPPQPSPAQPAE